LQVGDLSADQMTFVKTIISYLSKNGTIDKSMFFEPPFTHLNDQGINGVFDLDQKHKIFKIVEHINFNAIA
jgi:type I restriction enzyme, R subunit